jgi:N-acetylglucosaminyldiphosphoundecaprenol N-acetyl-beta-D-mannosaminyltransferase
MTARNDRISSFLDIAVHRLTKDELTQTVREAIENGRRSIIANHNLHSLYLFHRDKTFREFYKLAGVVHADGIGVVLLSALGGRRLKREHRTTYADWMPDLIALAARNRWRLFFVASKPGIAAQGAARLREQWPGLRIETAHGYFDAARGSPDNRRLLGRIREYRPHILFAGMGMPRQERWIAENLADLECDVVLQAGAVMDCIAGAVVTPPRWTGRLGLEWLFRLTIEPRRLAFRYLIEPWYIARLVLFTLVPINGLRVFYTLKTWA